MGCCYFWLQELLPSFSHPCCPPSEPSAVAIFSLSRFSWARWGVLGWRGGLYMGCHWCLPLCVHAKVWKEHSTKKSSLQQHIIQQTWHKHTCPLQEKDPGAPLNTVLLLLNRINGLLASRRLENPSARVWIVQLPVEGWTVPVTWLEWIKRPVVYYFVIVQFLCGRLPVGIHKNKPTWALSEYAHFRPPSVRPPRFSFQHNPAPFPCHRPFLPPHRQRLSWPPVTQKQVRLSGQPAVVRTKWRTFIFRCISFKTISIGLRGTLARTGRQISDAVVLGGTALTASRHRHARTCKQHSHLSSLSAYEKKRSWATLPGLALSSLRIDPAVEEP